MVLVVSEVQLGTSGLFSWAASEACARENLGDFAANYKGNCDENFLKTETVRSAPPVCMACAAQ